MEPFVIVAILSATFLIALWLLWKRLRGAAGPVIIITPPPDSVRVAKPLDWELQVGGNSVKIEPRPNLRNKIPGHLLANILEGFATLNVGGNTVGIQTLTITFSNGEIVLLSNNDEGKLRWEKAGPNGKKWKSSGGAVHQWPGLLFENVTDLQFVDAEDTAYSSGQIQSITIVLN